MAEVFEDDTQREGGHGLLSGDTGEPLGLLETQEGDEVGEGKSEWLS